ncbi:hypothetical protein GE09DRAFT_1239090 [Coniochaeta sp. 2T2.1]|nr:hypothetical protein GE09DRAFT_1239090 [Coniochaeta sp. 2T2.1]
MRLIRATLLCASTVMAFDPSQTGLYHRQQPVPDIVPLVLISGFSQRRNRLFPSGRGRVSPRQRLRPLRVPIRLLISGNTYNVSWKKTADNDDYPVRLRWLFFDPAKDGVNERTAKWETNTTEAFFMFRPNDVLHEFLTSLAPDLQPGVAGALATADMWNYIEITQPEHPLAGDSKRSPKDVSQPFTIHDSFIEAFFENAAANARNEEYGGWKRGVGIGVGVGVPVLMALAALIGWSFGKKRGRRVVAKQ